MVTRRDERIARFALGSDNRGGRLKSGDAAPELVEALSVDRIDPDPGQPRHHFDADELQELADSITSVGQIQPIIVVRAGDRYLLHVGERRWRACQLAGLATVRAIVRATPPEARPTRLAQITENEQRADLLTSELIDAVGELQVLGMKNVEIAAALAKPPSRISELQALADAPPALCAIVDRIGLGLSYQLLRRWRTHSNEALDFIALMPIEHISRVTIATIGQRSSDVSNIQPIGASGPIAHSLRTPILAPAEGEGAKARAPTAPSSTTEGRSSRSSTHADPSLLGILVVEHPDHGRGHIVFGLDVPVDHFVIRFADGLPVTAHKNEVSILSARLQGARDA